MAGTLGDLHIMQNIEAIVVSCNGWSWVLAWAQLGVARVFCYPLTSLAKKQLLPLISLLNDTVTIVMDPLPLLEKGCRRLVSSHVGTDRDLDLVSQFLTTIPADTCILLSGNQVANL
jgi:hypothetical protein